MSKKRRVRNYLAFREETGGPDLGRLVAENDQNLREYYVDSDRYVARALNVQDAAVFFMGPKGIGKSAVLQMVRLNRTSETERTINLSPDDLAFSALANVEAQSPFLSEAGRNQWLFKSLWDYVLSLEILRREYRNESAFSQYFLSIFRGKHEKEARKPL
jgi:hypothetical protein